MNDAHHDAVVRHLEGLQAELLSSLKECALQIAQNHGRKLTADEQTALDNARIVIAKASS